MSDDEWNYYFDLGFHQDFLEELEQREKGQKVKNNEGVTNGKRKCKNRNASRDV